MADVEKADVGSKNFKTHQSVVESTGSGRSDILRPNMATIEDDDERLLARMGIRQVCPCHRYEDII